MDCLTIFSASGLLLGSPGAFGGNKKGGSKSSDEDGGSDGIHPSSKDLVHRFGPDRQHITIFRPSGGIGHVMEPAQILDDSVLFYVYLLCICSTLLRLVFCVHLHVLGLEEEMVCLKL